MYRLVLIMAIEDIEVCFFHVYILYYLAVIDERELSFTHGKLIIRNYFQLKCLFKYYNVHYS